MSPVAGAPRRRPSPRRLPALPRLAGHVRARRHPALLALALALAFVMAGCGATPDPTPAVATAPSTPAAATPSGAPTPAATPLPPGSFTFDLPAGWRAVPLDGSHDGLVAELAAVNPSFAESLGARLSGAPDTATYFAFDGSPQAVATGDVVTLVVTEVDLPLDVSEETFAAGVRDQVERLIEGTVELRQILVAAGRASSMAYLAPLTRPDGQEGTIAVTQVLYALPGRGYVITFGAPPPRANDYARTLADIATSFRIVF